MKIGKWIVASISVLALTACGETTREAEEDGENITRAALMGVDQAQHGEVIVATGDTGLIVQLTAEGLSPGQHGVHIHETGKCEGPDYKSAGGHWNPQEKAHGFDNSQGAHMGDFFNLDIGEDGKGSLEAVVEGGVLKGGKNALLDEDGAAFIVHAGPDDLKTDPSGESGARIACGVFSGS